MKIKLVVLNTIIVIDIMMLLPLWYKFGLKEKPVRKLHLDFQDGLLERPHHGWTAIIGLGFWSKV